MISRLDVAAIDRLLDAWTRKKLFSGDVLIAVGDHVLLRKQYGFANWSSCEPQPENGIYRVGSVTKQFTAAAILRLEEQGLLATEDSVATYIPEMPAALHAGAGVPVTIHHLVTHTSGLPDPLYANFWGSERVFDSLLGALEGTTLRHAPGTEFHYNNLGYAVLGEIVRRISGRSFEQFLRSELFHQSGMDGSGIKPDPCQHRRMVTGHISNVFRPVPSQEVFGRFMKGSYDWDLLANGNVFSAVSDLHKWVRSLQEGTTFPPAVIDKMLTPAQLGYAYGWVKRDVEDLGEPLYWHNGATIPFGYTADLGWTRAGLCIVILANLDESAVAVNVFDNVIRVVRDQPVVAPRAGYRARRSYLTIQIIALLVGTPLGAVIFALYATLVLALRKPRSTREARSTVASVVSLGLVVAYVSRNASGALALTLSAGLSVWHILRSRRAAANGRCPRTPRSRPA
jgi:CubicO group peptidase (beta-lactamase class C family)